MAILLAIFGYSLLPPASVQVRQPEKVVVPSNQASPAPLEINRGIPVRLQIPSIGVDAPVEYTGVNAAGDMVAPTGTSSVGWYKLGAIPGNVGSAVMDGHVVGPKGEPAVFARLNKLKPGDQIMVVDAKGLAATFVVREVRTYSETEQHDAVFNSTSGTHLNIITCAGEWDSAQRHYLNRFVVFADKSST
ncbi:MAG: class F sortase [Candidatus Saccharibacteria bacterium]